MLLGKETKDKLVLSSNAFTDKDNVVWPRESLLTKLQKTCYLKSDNTHTKINLLQIIAHYFKRLHME